MSDTPDTPISERIQEAIEHWPIPAGVEQLLIDADIEIDRLTAALAERDATIAELRGRAERRRTTDPVRGGKWREETL